MRFLFDVGHAGERLWCGGRNLAAEYFEGQPGHSAWRDLSFDLQGALEGFGYEVVGIASSAEAAVTKCAQLHPDVVFMDINLKGTEDGGPGKTNRPCRRILQEHGLTIGSFGRTNLLFGIEVGLVRFLFAIERLLRQFDTLPVRLNRGPGFFQNIVRGLQIGRG